MGRVLDYYPRLIHHKSADNSDLAKKALVHSMYQGISGVLLTPGQRSPGIRFPMYTISGTEDLLNGTVRPPSLRRVGQRFTEYCSCLHNGREY